MTFESLLAVAGLVLGGVSPCPPVEVANMIKESSESLFESKVIPPTSLCGDISGDGVEDFCGVLTQDGSWRAGCFVSRTRGYKFESIADSTSLGLQNVTPDGIYLELVPAGERFEWSQGAAEVVLKRDCVSFGKFESGLSLHCYNGAYFLSMQEGD